jgi:predicted RNase H-like HicB family nuclease
MEYPVALTHTEEGCSVSCPGLPGCWSQGAAEEEALANIRDAIHEYLEVARSFDAHTMRGIVRDAGLNPEQFRRQPRARVMPVSSTSCRSGRSDLRCPE